MLENKRHSVSFTLHNESIQGYCNVTSCGFYYCPARANVKQEGSIVAGFQIVTFVKEQVAHSSFTVG